MFKNTYQGGLLSIFFSVGSNPLSIWDSTVHNGHIKRISDDEVNSLVLEIISTNVATTYMSCPRGNKVLGIKLPFIVMIIKNMKRYFSFEITILDDKNMRRRFRTSNFQSTTKIKPFCTSMPIGLASGWNQVQFNLSDFTKRAYGTQYIETLRVQIHANVRIRRIFFCDRLYETEQLPKDYKLFLPFQNKDIRGAKQESVKGEAPKVLTTEHADPESDRKLEATAEQEIELPVQKVQSKTSKASMVSEVKPPSRKSSVKSPSIITVEGRDNVSKGSGGFENVIVNIEEEQNGNQAGEAEDTAAVEEMAEVEEPPVEEEPTAGEVDEEPTAGEVDDEPNEEQNLEKVEETAEA